MPSRRSGFVADASAQTFVTSGVEKMVASRTVASFGIWSFPAYDVIRFRSKTVLPRHRLALKKEIARRTTKTKMICLPARAAMVRWLMQPLRIGLLGKFSDGT